MITIISLIKIFFFINIRNFRLYLYLSLYRSSFNDFSFSPLALALALALGRFSSGVELRDERFSGVGLRLDGTRVVLPVVVDAVVCGGKDPGGKP
jgi:hypothetical protein